MRKFLCLLLLLSLLIPSALGEEGARKNEVIYARLDASGAVLSACAVNAFEAENDCEIVDYGDYSAVYNLTDARALEYKDGAVALSLPRGRFSYQGDLKNAQLPWTISISYTLDGAEIAPEALSGASGKLDMSVSVLRNPDGDVDYFNAFTVQLTLTLDGDKCLDIQAPGATLALAGGNRTAAFVLLPGMEGTFTLSANVTDFAMDGVQIACLPMTMDAEMYVSAFSASMEDSALKPALQNVIRNMISGMSANCRRSFTSAQNGEVEGVQFVLITDGIPRKQREAASDTAAETAQQGFFDRLLSLFK